MHIGQQVVDLATAIHTRIGVERHDTARTDPRPGAVRQLKSDTEHNMTVGGADPAGQAIKAGLVDELQLFLIPVAVGGGEQALPTGVHTDLELLDTQSFAGGAVHLRYRPKPA